MKLNHTSKALKPYHKTPLWLKIAIILLNVQSTAMVRYIYNKI